RKKVGYATGARGQRRAGEEIARAAEGRRPPRRRKERGGGRPPAGTRGVPAAAPRAANEWQFTEERRRTYGRAPTSTTSRAVFIRDAAFLRRDGLLVRRGEESGELLRRHRGGIRQRRRRIPEGDDRLSEGRLAPARRAGPHHPRVRRAFDRRRPQASERADGKR